MGLPNNLLPVLGAISGGFAKGMQSSEDIMGRLLLAKADREAQAKAAADKLLAAAEKVRQEQMGLILGKGALARDIPLVKKKLEEHAFVRGQDEWGMPLKDEVSELVGPSPIKPMAPMTQQEEENYRFDVKEREALMKRARLPDTRFALEQLDQTDLAAAAEAAKLGQAKKELVAQHGHDAKLMSLTDKKALAVALASAGIGAMPPKYLEGLTDQEQDAVNMKFVGEKAVYGKKTLDEQFKSKVKALPSLAQQAEADAEFKWPRLGKEFRDAGYKPKWKEEIAAAKELAKVPEQEREALIVGVRNRFRKPVKSNLTSLLNGVVGDDGMEKLTDKWLEGITTEEQGARMVEDLKDAMGLQAIVLYAKDIPDHTDSVVRFMDQKPARDGDLAPFYNKKALEEFVSDLDLKPSQKGAIERNMERIKELRDAAGVTREALEVAKRAGVRAEIDDAEKAHRNAAETLAITNALTLSGWELEEEKDVDGRITYKAKKVKRAGRQPFTIHSTVWAPNKMAMWVIVDPQLVSAQVTAKANHGDGSPEFKAAEKAVEDARKAGNETIKKLQEGTGSISLLPVGP